MSAAMLPCTWRLFNCVNGWEYHAEKRAWLPCWRCKGRGEIDERSIGPGGIGR